MTNAQNSFQQLLLNKDWLANFQAPTTEAIYDHRTERSAPLNKYLFTKEIPEYVPQEKADVIENLESKIHEVAATLKDSQNTLKESYKALNELDGQNQIKEINLEIAELIEKDKEYYNKNLSVEILENLIKFYFNELKDCICINELDWLNESYIFYAEDNRRRINDKPNDARSWKTPFDRGIGQISWIEKSLANGLIEPLRYDLHKEDIDVYPTNQDPYYSTTKLNKNLNVLRENGLEHIFPNHPIYKEHLAKTQVSKEGEYYQEKFDERKNKYFLENGHRYDTKTRELFDILKKLNVKGKNLISIKDYQEFQSLNFSKEEKEKFFFNLIFALLISNKYNQDTQAHENSEIINSHLEKGLDSDLLNEISKRKQLNKLWNEVYEPWHKIEKDKYDFFETVRKRTREDVKTSTSKRDFLWEIENSAAKTIDRFYEEYSYEIRTSSHFDSRFNTKELIKNIKEIYENVLKNDFYVRNEMKNGSISPSLNPRFEKRNLTEYQYVYDSNTYVKMEDLKDSVFFDKEKNQFNKYMLDYQNYLFLEEINKLRKYYDVATAGMQGSIIIDKVLDFFEENIPMSRCTGEANSLLLFLKNYEILQTEMIEKHGKDFFIKEKPVYFPTAKLILEKDIDYITKHYDKNSFIHRNLIKMKDNGYLNGLDELLSFKEIEILIKTSLSRLTLNKSEESIKISKLELKKSEIATTHNKLVGNIKTTDEKRESELKQYLELTKNLKKEKIENYSSKNKIDEEKFFTVLSTIVDLIKNQENKDKIIDLSKSDENQDNLERFFQSFKNSYKDVFFENYFKSFEKLKEIPILNKQYFPLFIDLESHAIFSVEWTTKYPMLHITLLPEVYKLIEDLNSLSVDEIIEDMNKEINERKIKSVNFKFTKNEIEEIKNKIDNKESISWFIKKFKDLEKTYTLDDLDRVKDIFSLIQTNYFLQMDQIEENALFLDIDANFLNKPKPNIGAVPFMNKEDLDLLSGVHNKDKDSYNNNLKFIDPYNYSIEGKDESLSAFNIQNRKVEGLPSEQRSKDGMKSAKIGKQRFIEKGKLDVFETRELISKTEALYGYNHFNNNKGETLDSSIYRKNPEKLKLFKTKEELDNYIKKYNEVINKEELFESFITNSSKIYHFNEEFVRRVLGYIYLTKGLSQSELLELISSDVEFTSTLNLLDLGLEYTTQSKEPYEVLWEKLNLQLKDYVKYINVHNQIIISFDNKGFDDIINKFLDKEFCVQLIDLLQKLILKNQFLSIEINRWSDLYISVVENYHLKFEFDYLLDNNSKIKLWGEFLSSLENENYVEYIVKTLIKNYSELNNTSREFYFYNKFLYYFVAILYKINSSKYSKDYEDILNNLADCYYKNEKYNEAIELYKEALPIKKELYNNDSKKYSVDYEDILNNLADCYYKNDKYDEAIELYKELLLIKKELYKNDSKKYSKDYEDILSNLANCYYKNNNYNEAIELYKESLPIKKELYKNDSKKYSEDYGNTLSTLGDYYYKNDKYDEAIELYKEVLPIKKELYKNDSKKYSEDYGNTLSTLGDYYYKNDKYYEAIELYTELLPIKKELYNNNKIKYFKDYEDILNNLANSYYKNNNYSEAIKIYKELLPFREELYKYDSKEYSTDYANTLNNLAICYYKNNNYSEAIKIYKELLQIREELYKDGSKKYSEDYGNILSNLGDSYYKNQNYNEAIKFYKELLQIRKELYKNDSEKYSEEYGDILNNLANSYYQNKNYNEAIELYKELLQIREELYKNDSSKFSENYRNILNNLANSYYENNKYNEAIELYKELLQIREELYKNDSEKYLEDYGDILSNLGNCYRLNNKHAEAISIFTEVVQIRKKLNKDYKNILDYLNFSLAKIENEDKVNETNKISLISKLWNKLF